MFTIFSCQTLQALLLRMQPPGWTITTPDPESVCTSPGPGGLGVQESLRSLLLASGPQLQGPGRPVGVPLGWGSQGSGCCRPRPPPATREWGLGAGWVRPGAPHCWTEGAGSLARHLTMAPVGMWAGAMWCYGWLPAVAGTPEATVTTGPPPASLPCTPRECLSSTGPSRALHKGRAERGQPSPQGLQDLLGTDA